MNRRGKDGWLAGWLGAAASCMAALPVPQVPGVGGRVGSEPQAVSSGVTTGVATYGATASARPTNIRDRMNLTSGEWLLGKFLGIDPERGVVLWTHSLSASNWELRSSGVREILLARRGEPPARMTDGAVVRLTNGDQLLGRLESLDATQLVLHCGGAGRLCIPRSMVAEIVAAAATDEVLYEGPNELSEWSVRGEAQRQWEVRENALVPLNPSPIGLVARDAGDRLKIEFTMEWQGLPSYLTVWFFHERPDGPSGDAYMMNIMAGQRVELTRMNARGGARNLGSLELSGVTRPRGQLALTILADRKSGVIALCEDHRLLREWKDTTPFEGRGTAVSFMSQGGGALLKLSNIRIARWNGLLPVGREVRKRDADTILLANGDLISGRLEKVERDVLVIEFAYGPAGRLELPADRVAQVALAEEFATRARRRKGDVRLHFWDGSRITLKLDRADETTIVGASENFGSAAWPLQWVRRIELDPYSDVP